MIDSVIFSSNKTFSNCFDKNIKVMFRKFYNNEKRLQKCNFVIYNRKLYSSNS